MKRVVINYIVIAVMAVLAALTSCNEHGDYPKEFSVTFETGDDDNSVAPQKVKEGEKVIKPDDLTRCGYTFLAWYKETEWTNEWKFDTDEVTANVTLYAKWSVNDNDEEIEDNPDEEDPMYPTTIYRLPEETLLQMRNDFAQKNPNVYSILNQFGFCDRGGIYWPSGNPGGFTEEEAIAAAKEFVVRNPEYTGVSNPDNLQFRNVSSTGYNNAINWYLYSENQIFNETEVVFTQFSFRTHNKTLIWCDGNHFPNVYVPEKFNYDVERAKSQLLGKEIFHWGKGGQYSEGIVTAEHLQQSTTKLIIVPVKTDEKIELRVTWQINTPLFHIFEIDVMTGEIIREMTTRIS